jgi:hypothetical protein
MPTQAGRSKAYAGLEKLVAAWYLPSAWGLFAYCLIMQEGFFELRSGALILPVRVAGDAAWQPSTFKERTQSFEQCFRKEIMMEVSLRKTICTYIGKTCLHSRDNIDLID